MSEGGPSRLNPDAPYPSAPEPAATPDGRAGSGTKGDDWSRTQAISFGTSTLTLLVNVATGVLIARALGTSGRGELTAIIALPATIGWIFAMGCFQAVSFHHAKHPEDGGRLITSWLVLLLPLSAVAIGAGYALLPSLFAAQTDATMDLARIYLLTILFQLFAEVTFGIVLGDQDFTFYNGVRLVLPVLTAVAYLGLWLADQFTVGSALLATFLAGVTVSAAVLVRILRRHGLARPNAPLMRSTLWYGARAHGANVGSLVNTRLDLLIIPAFLNASTVGLYAVAIAAISVVPIIAGAMSALVLPAAARQGADGVGTVIRSLHATLAVALLLAIALAVLAEPAVTLVYGSAFDGSVQPLRLLLPGTVLYVAAGILWSGLYAVNRPATATAAQVAGAVVTVVGLLIFLRTGGVTAAALVSSASYAVVFVAALILYRRAAALRWKDFLPGRLPAARPGTDRGSGGQVSAAERAAPHR